MESDEQFVYKTPFSGSFKLCILDLKHILSTNQLEPVTFDYTRVPVTFDYTS